MFESDQKKELQNKYNKLSSITTGGKAKKGAWGNLASHLSGGQDTVYGELKLSEQLSGELGLVRDQVMNLQESLEESLFLNTKYQKELNQGKKEIQKKNTEIC